MSVECKNARIESTSLGREDHGIFTYTITLDYGGSGQGFGMFALDEWDEAKKQRRGTAFGAAAIAELLRVVGVSEWEKLPGTPVRVMACHTGVQRIGHFIKDQWLDLKELAAEYTEATR